MNLSNLSIILLSTIFVIHYISYRRDAWMVYKKTRDIFHNITKKAIINNENDTAKFLEDEISSWSKSGQDFYTRRYLEVLKFIEEYQEERYKKRTLKILDIGCGDCYLFEQIIKNTNTEVELYGIDISSKRIELAHKRFKKQKNIVHFTIGDAEYLPYENNYFDIITSIENLEHLTNPDKSINEMIGVVKAGGLIVLSIPSLHTAFLSYINPITVINPLIWLESLVSLLYPASMPPFHNLYNPKNKNTVIHRAFTIHEMKNLFNETSKMKIHTSDFFFEEFLPKHISYKLNKLLKNIPIVNKLGRRIIVIAEK